jgi:hypothetical protein
MQTVCHRTLPCSEPSLAVEVIGTASFEKSLEEKSDNSSGQAPGHATTTLIHRLEC